MKYRPLRPCRLALAVTLAVLPTVAADAVTYRHDNAEAEHAAFADLDAFAAVGRLTGATATLISPTQVLSAAHAPNSWTGPGAFRIYRLDGSGNPVKTHEAGIVGWDEHPGHRAYGGQELSVSPFDLQIAELDAPLTGVTPMPLSIADPLGMTGVVIGHGQQGTGLTGGQGSIGDLKLAGTNVIDLAPSGTGTPNVWYFSDYLRVDMDAPNESAANMQPGSPFPTAVEAVGDNGDSGGPLLVDFGEGYRVVGASSGSNGDGEYGVWTSYAPIAGHSSTADFLYKHDFTFASYTAGEAHLENASFEFDTFADGKTFTDNAAGWFEIDAAGDVNSVAIAGDGVSNRPDSPHGGQWLNLKNAGTSAYQQVGLWEAGQTLSLDLTLGDKYDRTWDGLLVQLLAGAGQGADGYELTSFATLLDEVLIDAATWASFGIDTADGDNHTLDLTVDLLTAGGGAGYAAGTRCGSASCCPTPSATGRRAST